ncbi:DUF4919 domain-containing protein [Fulvivirga maritima]|uniref:DUF4919 domain-containing protein n=1 Tax=Fulvivirga maritima TaxID=2904247 RepID=UPI001F2FE966|nr:DUF4919 domain-containing protein [Fulvivirga maritima]UII26884.1 DUF4919 domain-containing protein [Fulvivirga maritima]
MKKALYTTGLLSLIAAFTSCSMFKKEDLKSNSTTYKTTKELFKTVSFYRDLDLINEAVTDSNSHYYFKRLLRSFLSDSLDMNEQESVALLYGALNHPGYGKNENVRLERKADSLMDKQKYSEAILTANKCLETFPLSAKATMVMWYSYLQLNKKDSSEVYAHRLGTIFEGMQASGYSEDKSRPQIALSKNAIEEYFSKHAVGAGLEFDQEYKDSDGNLILVYSSSLLKERFVIPKR